MIETPNFLELQDLHSRATGHVIRLFNEGTSAPLGCLLYNTDGEPSTQPLPLDLMYDIFTDAKSPAIRKAILKQLAVTLLSSSGIARLAMASKGEMLPSALLVSAEGLFHTEGKNIVTLILTPNQTYIARSPITGTPQKAVLGPLEPVLWTDLDVVDGGIAH